MGGIFSLISMSDLNNVRKFITTTVYIPGVMKTGSANLNFLCNFSQLPQCLILACLLLVYY